MIEFLKLPKISFDEKTHTYSLDDGEKLGKESISRISKIADGDNFGLASGWAAKLVSGEILNLFKADTSYTTEEIELMAKDAKSAPRKIRDSAAVAGSGFHFYAEQYCRWLINQKSESEHPISLGMSSLRPDLPQEETEKRCAESIKEFIDEHIEPVGSELRVLYKPQSGYPIPGTTDLVCRLKSSPSSELCVLDWKGVTSFRYNIRASHVVQLYAYGQALRQAGNDITHLILVRIERESGKLLAHKFGFDRADTLGHLFESCINISRYKEPHKMEIGGKNA
jgi:hypothetical protein